MRGMTDDAIDCYTRGKSNSVATVSVDEMLAEVENVENDERYILAGMKEAREARKKNWRMAIKQFRKQAATALGASVFMGIVLASNVPNGLREGRDIIITNMDANEDFVNGLGSVNVEDKKEAIFTVFDHGMHCGYSSAEVAIYLEGKYGIDVDYYNTYIYGKSEYLTVSGFLEDWTKLAAVYKYNKEHKNGRGY